MPQAELTDRIRQLIVETLHLEGLDPESIDPDMPLFGDAGLGLDSIDVLELVVALERELGISIPSSEVGEETFASVAAIAALVGRLRWVRRAR